MNEVHPDQLILTSSSPASEVPLEESESSKEVSHLLHMEKPLDPASVVAEMTSHIYHGRVKNMAIIYHLFCRPGDWQNENMPRFGRELREYYTENLHEEQAPWFAAVIQYEWEAALFTDQVVQLFNLPLPNNKICILWDPSRCGFPGWGLFGISKRRQGLINLMLYPTFHTPCRFGHFHRPREYLIAAILKARMSRIDMLALITSIGKFIDRVKAFDPNKPSDESIEKWIEEWLMTEPGRKANMMFGDNT